MKFSIGFDFGTNSCRGILVNISSGKEECEHVYHYKKGSNGVILAKNNPLLARQHPIEYTNALIECTKKIITKAKKKINTFSPDRVIGLGVDTTGSSPMPVDKEGKPLALNKKYKNNLNALVWLWKDHTSFKEAEIITNLANKLFPEYLKNIGGRYSSEWFWSKIFHLKNIDPKLFNSIYSFVEICDYIPALLSGNTNPLELKRSACAAGHKALYNEKWGGLPDKKFLNKLDPKIAVLKNRLYKNVYSPEEPAGYLSEIWAKKLGLKKNIKIAMGGFDAHIGAVGANIEEKVLVKVMGTSTCDIAIQSQKKKIKNIPGVCGIVKNSVISNYLGIEAGQSAVGDIFASYIKNNVGEKYGKNFKEKFSNLEKLASQIKPGEHGLLSLDWHNGNRTILVDTALSGLLVGQNLQTKQHEIFKALIEATAFGSLMIIDQIENHGVSIKEIIAIGGLSQSYVIMQIYADITGRKIKVLKSDQVCAVGSAILAACNNKEGYLNLKTTQKKMSVKVKKIYHPNMQNNKIYKRIYKLYSNLHDVFGRVNNKKSLHHIMKELILIRNLY